MRYAHRLVGFITRVCWFVGRCLCVCFCACPRKVDETRESHVQNLVQKIVGEPNTAIACHQDIRTIIAHSLSLTIGSSLCHCVCVSFLFFGADNVIRYMYNMWCMFLLFHSIEREREHNCLYFKLLFPI